MKIIGKAIKTVIIAIGIVFALGIGYFTVCQAIAPTVTIKAYDVTELDQAIKDSGVDPEIVYAMMTSLEETAH